MPGQLSSLLRRWLHPVVAAGLLLGAPAFARDLGVIGPVYPIAEPDLLQEIQAVLKAKQASGELERLQAEASRRIQARIATPVPVAGLKRAQTPRRTFFDPTVRFDENITDHQGRVVVAAGTVANPLSVVTWHRELLFFDGRDPAQVAYARDLVIAAAGTGTGTGTRADSAPSGGDSGGATLGAIKPILTGGSPLELSRQWQRPVYFDQGGKLVERLGIKAVPARVRQDGQLLRIDEVPVR
jgi:conjugal transfer pilus assembly protein TraW